VNFIDDIHLEFSELRRIAYLIDEVPDVFDGVIGAASSSKIFREIGFPLFLQTH
jgi:hypothetical protein